MDAAQIHLALNHFPLILTLGGAAILAIAYFRKSTLLFRTATMVLVISALAALPTYFTGEGAEEVVENYAGVTEQYIHAHEESAELTFLVIEALGLISLVSLAITRKRAEFPKGLSLGLLLLSIVIFGSTARTAHLGGQIRHQELRAANAQTQPMPEED